MTTIDPATATQIPASSTAGLPQRKGIAEDFTAFLNLLTTQLKSQNPLEPLDANSFTQQLVQFSGVEQQLQTNDTLNKLVTQNQTNALNANIDLLGATVSAESDGNKLNDGKASWTLNAARPAQGTEIKIVNEAGNVVWREKINLQAGENTYMWTGKTINNQQINADQIFKIETLARDSAGKSIKVTPSVQAKITGVVLNKTSQNFETSAGPLIIDAFTAIRRPEANAPKQL